LLGGVGGEETKREKRGTGGGWWLGGTVGKNGEPANKANMWDPAKKRGGGKAKRGGISVNARTGESRGGRCKRYGVVDGGRHGVRLKQ